MDTILQVQKRLLVRGGKLLVIFTLLNVLAHLMLRRGRNGERLDVFSFFDHWQEVYFTGTGRFAVFEVLLLPISYLLILAPLLIQAGYRQRFLLPAITLAFLSLCTLLENQGYSFANLNLLSAGTLGMLIGRLPAVKLDVLGRYVIFTILAYTAYAYLGAVIGQSYLIQLLGATVALALIFGMCTRFKLLGLAAPAAYSAGSIFPRRLHRPDRFFADPFPDNYTGPSRFPWAPLFCSSPHSS